MANVGISLTDIDRGQISAAVNKTLVEGSKVSSWWKAQERSLVTGVTRTVRAGLNNGLTSQQIATNLRRNVFKGSKAQAQALVSTSINAVSNKARVMSFEENKDVIKGMQQVSTLDGRTSDICIAYSGMAWDFDGDPLPDTNTTLPFNGGPPRHFNCRSTLIPVLRSFEELGLGTQRKIPPGTRASMDGQIADDITFSQWLRKKPKTFQDSLLGPARAKLWRGNKITLNQLVDMRGNPLTVEQLREVSRKKRKPPPATPTAAAAAVVAPPPAPAAPPATDVDPFDIPVFTSRKDALNWMEKNGVSGQYADLEGRKTTLPGRNAEFGEVDMGIYSQLPRINRMMQERFDVVLPPSITTPVGHPKFNLESARRSRANAAMLSDDNSYLVFIRGVSRSSMRAQHAAQRSNRVANLSDKDFQSETAVMRKSIERSDLTSVKKKAMLDALDDVERTGELTHSAAGAVGTESANFMGWRTMIHESGHRLMYASQQNRVKFNRILSDMSPDELENWQWLTSRYARANRDEFVAEQFVWYMMGREGRVHPEFIKLFKEFDKGGDFGWTPTTGRIDDA
jgi:SPP1 gp7 family putative phage head morphogenesis protein